MENLGGNLKRRNKGTNVSGLRSPKSSVPNFTPRPTAQTKRTDYALPQAPSMATKPVVEDKNARKKRESFTFRSPIVLKRPKSDILQDIKNGGIKSGKFVWNQARTIHKHPAKLALVALVVLIAFPFSLRFGFGGSKKGDSPKDVEGAQTVAVDVTPITPGGSRDFDESSIKKDTVRGTANFQDNLNGVLITVTQQNLPADFSPEKLKEIAATVGATEEFETRFGKAYLATADGESAVGQRVVFATDDLLIFISAASKFTTEKWADYINNLR